MDTLYIGDIPSDYCYAIFGDNYIDLYNSSNVTVGSQFYRIYFYDNYFAYDSLVNTSITATAKYINVTNYYMYRRDISNIAFLSLTICLLLTLLLNLVTSIFKKGGVLSGLL